jgi:TatD DNase family protein
MSQLHLTDSHAHLTSSDLFNEIDHLLKNAQDVGVKTIVNICTDPLSLEKGLLLSKTYPWIYQTAAITPHDVGNEGANQAFELIAHTARQGLLKAIGETGLDYHYEHSDRSIQKEHFIKYLHLALECQLPVVIHCREAFADFFEILDAEFCVAGKVQPGVLHCFTGTLEEAKEVIKRGWMLSLSGIVTFKKSTALQEVARMVPLDHLLIETDAPFLAPQKHRGKQNQPAYLLDTALFIAQLKGISLEELAHATTANAKKLFNLRDCR